VVEGEQRDAEDWWVQNTSIKCTIHRLDFFLGTWTKDCPSLKLLEKKKFMRIHPIKFTGLKNDLVTTRSSDSGWLVLL
jgi:hypothetical protein